MAENKRKGRGLNTAARCHTIYLLRLTKQDEIHFTQATQELTVHCCHRIDSIEDEYTQLLCDRKISPFVAIDDEWFSA
jgi:hypothetical protein